MQIKHYFIFLFISLLFFNQAFALEPSSVIKVTPILKTTSSWNGAPITYPQGQAEITGMIVEVAPGAETGWHIHPVPTFGMILEGEMTVELKTGETKHLKAGDSVVEVINTLHNGKNTGSSTLKMLVFYAGAVGEQLTVKEKSN